MAAQVAARRAQLAGSQNAYERVLDQVVALEVRAGIAGVLTRVEVEEGGQVQLGANIARVVRPDELQAELKVAETQVRDVLRGQIVAVDTRGGVVAGVVTRVAPTAVEGSVQVDVELTGALPRGARMDQSVDGTIDIERIPNAVQTGRATNSQQNSTVSLFKVIDDGRYAVRVPVQIGRTSVNSIEILQGLVPGDRVILSDTSAFEDNDRIRLN
jgi:HlyD family secretion protein